MTKRQAYIEALFIVSDLCEIIDVGFWECDKNELLPLTEKETIPSEKDQDKILKQVKFISFQLYSKAKKMQYRTKKKVQSAPNSCKNNLKS